MVRINVIIVLHLFTIYKVICHHDAVSVDDLHVWMLTATSYINNFDKCLISQEGCEVDWLWVILSSCRCFKWHVHCSRTPSGCLLTCDSVCVKLYISSLQSVWVWRFFPPDHQVLIVSYCDWSLSGVCRASRFLQNTSPVFICLLWILTKLHRNGPCMVPYYI